MPAYKCPASHAYLYAQGYAPFGTSLPDGVEVAGLGPIGVSITGIKTSGGWAIGTTTGIYQLERDELEPRHELVPGEAPLQPHQERVLVRGSPLSRRRRAEPRAACRP